MTTHVDRPILPLERRPLPSRPGLLAVVCSELVRLRRPALLAGWLGLTALFASLVDFVMFQVVPKTAAATAQAPGTSFPPASVLRGSSGLVAGLGAGSSFFGVITLSFWALAVASDYSTGLIRVLAAAQPRRWCLVVGKLAALTLLTAAAALVALLVTLITSPVAASAGGWTPDTWRHDVAGTIISATGNLSLALLVWGALGALLAIATRSSGIAIGIGVGWVLLVEAVITAAAKHLGTWLPGGVISALARGGTPDLGYRTALGSSLVYALVALAAIMTIARRRDITD